MQTGPEVRRINRINCQIDIKCTEKQAVRNESLRPEACANVKELVHVHTFRATLTLVFRAL